MISWIWNLVAWPYLVIVLFSRLFSSGAVDAVFSLSYDELWVSDRRELDQPAIALAMVILGVANIAIYIVKCIRSRSDLAFYRGFLTGNIDARDWRRSS